MASVHPRQNKEMEMEIYCIHCSEAGQRKKDRHETVVSGWSEGGVKNVGNVCNFPFSGELGNDAWLKVALWSVRASGYCKVGCLMSLFGSA